MSGIESRSECGRRINWEDTRFAAHYWAVPFPLVAPLISAAAVDLLFFQATKSSSIVGQAFMLQQKSNYTVST